MVPPGLAAQVPVRDGQTVKLKLRNILTTDNVQKGEEIEFEVTEDVLVNGRVVIAKGATAHFPWDTAPRYLLHDRDSIYGGPFRQQVQGVGVREVLTPHSRLSKTRMRSD
jgi:hypothetical protein